MPNPPSIPLAFQPSAERLRLASADDLAKKSLAEKAFVVCVLVLSTTAFVNLLPGESGIEYAEQGKLFARILWSFLYLVMLIFVRKSVRELLHLLWGNKLLVLLLGWACLSVGWSIDRPVTIRHLGALLLSSFFGVYLACRFSLREQLRLVSVALWIVIASSVAACIFFPSYGIRTEQSTTGPAWQGVFSDKNALARTAVLAALILALYSVKRVRRPAVLIGILLIFFLVILTQAKTSLVYFLLGMVAFPFVRAFQNNPAKRRKIIAFALLTFGGVAAWTYYNWENFTYSLGKDPGLTGRVALWGLSMTWIADRPFVGHGFDAFWSDYYGPAADFRAASGWLEATHAHNGFINLWLDLGAIGVLIFAVGAAVTYRRTLELAKTSASVEGIWPVSFLAFYLVYSVTETSFLSRSDLLWILYVATVLAGQRFIERGQVEVFQNAWKQ